MDKQLKIFALEYIKEHDNLLKEERLALGQFVMEASDDLVKFMLLTGEVKDNLTEEDISFLEERNDWETFKSGYDHGRDTGVEAGAVGTIMVAAAVAAVTVAGVKAYKRFLSKAARACSGKSGLEKTSCMNQFKKQAQAAKIKELQSGMSKCAKTKDPARCKSKLQGKINKEKSSMGAL